MERGHYSSEIRLFVTNRNVEPPTDKNLWHKINYNDSQTLTYTIWTEDTNVNVTHNIQGGNNIGNTISIPSYSNDQYQYQWGYMNNDLTEFTTEIQQDATSNQYTIKYADIGKLLGVKIKNSYGNTLTISYLYNNVPIQSIQGGINIGDTISVPFETGVQYQWGYMNNDLTEFTTEIQQDATSNQYIIKHTDIGKRLGVRFSDSSGNPLTISYQNNNVPVSPIQGGTNIGDTISVETGEYTYQYQWGYMNNDLTEFTTEIQQDATSNQYIIKHTDIGKRLGVRFSDSSGNPLTISYQNNNVYFPFVFEYTVDFSYEEKLDHISNLNIPDISGNDFVATHFHLGDTYGDDWNGHRIIKLNMMEVDPNNTDIDGDGINVNMTIDSDSSGRDDQDRIYKKYVVLLKKNMQYKISMKRGSYSSEIRWFVTPINVEPNIVIGDTGTYSDNEFPGFYPFAPETLLRVKVTGTETSILINNGAGVPVITGEFRNGQLLTATRNGVTDTDALPPNDSDFTYRWKADDVYISGATQQTFLLTENEIGKRITVELSYTDAGDTPETLRSVPSAIVEEMRGSDIVMETITFNSRQMNKIKPDQITKLRDLIRLRQQGKQRNKFRMTMVKQMLEQQTEFVTTPQALDLQDKTQKQNVLCLSRTTPIEMKNYDLTDTLIYIPLEENEEVQLTNMNVIGTLKIKNTGEDETGQDLYIISNLSELDKTNFHVFPLEGGTDFNKDTLEGGFRAGDKIALSGNVFMFGSVELDGFDENLYQSTWCLLEGTLIKTDERGFVPIERLSKADTVKGYHIKAITHGLYTDNRMVLIKKDSIRKGVPERDTYVTPCHSLYLDHQFILARRLAEQNKNNIQFVTMETTPMVYNILFDEWLVLNAKRFTRRIITPTI